MNLYQPTISGSFTVSGSSTFYGNVTISGSVSATSSVAISSSYATSASNADFLDGLDSTYFVPSSSYDTMSGSIALRATNLESTASVLTSASASFAVVSSSYASASGSIASRVTKIEGNYATTGSNAFNGSQNITGSLTVSQAVIAQTLNVQQVTSSIVYSCGSNIFGCAIGDVQQMTGSVRITGSLNTIGNACITSVCSPSFIGGTMSGTTIYGSTVICSAVVCSPQSVFSYTGTTGNAVRINGDNLTTGTALSIVANNGSPSHTGNVVEICNAFNAGAAAKLLCLYQGDDGDGIYVNMARGGVGLTVDGVGSGYSAIFNNGNVGIGNTLPAELLDVCGSLKIGNLKIQNADGGRIGFNRNTATGAIYNSCYAAFQINGAYSGANYLDFQNYSSSGDFLGQFVLNNGNVGIGTTTPSQLLHLKTTLASSSGVGTAIQIESGGAGGDQGWIGVNKGTGNGLEISVENRDIIFNTGATTPFGGTERMRITSGGLVSINQICSYAVFNVTGIDCAWGEGIVMNPAPNGYSGINFRTEGRTGSCVTCTWQFAKETSGSGVGELFSFNKQGLTGGAGYRVDAVQQWKTNGDSIFGFRVGIGTCTPSTLYSLTLNGDSSTKTGGIVFRQSGTDTFYAGNPSVSNTTDFELWNPRNGYLRLATNNAERLRITSTGTVQNRGTGGTLVTQRLVGCTTAGSSGVDKEIAFIGFNHTINVKVLAYQTSDPLSSNVATLTQDIVTSFGNTCKINGGLTCYSNITNMSTGYGTGYKLYLNVTYSGAAPNVLFQIEGISGDTMTLSV